MSFNYEKRLQISIQGNLNTTFTTKSGLVVANGYERIVIGKRGPYIEFKASQLEGDNFYIPDEQKYRLEDKRVYYLELRTVDICNVKVYYQYKTVKYADYKVGFSYISPFDLLADGKIIIERLQ